jgi:hypothetical protein
MSDAIIVLGRGIENDGSLPPDPCSRVRKAVQLHHDRRASTIVMSGAWTYHFAINPTRTESSAMKEYACELGMSPDDIIEESRSRDTIGNVYFTKNICIERGWKDLVIVASDDHMPRIEYLFNKIFGPDYTLRFELSDRVIDRAAYLKEQAHEESSMSVTKQWFDTVTDGDDTAIWKIVLAKHPAYKQVSLTVHTTHDVDLYPDMP